MKDRAGAVTLEHDRRAVRLVVAAAIAVLYDRAAWRRALVTSDPLAATLRLTRRVVGQVYAA